MKDAFTSGVANFAGLTNSPEPELLCLSKCIHHSLILVDEGEGKTAEATELQPKATMQVAKFNATHPFIYLIRHKRTGSILFLGRMMNPSLGAKSFVSYATSPSSENFFSISMDSGGFHEQDIVRFDMFSIRGRASKIMLCLDVSKSMFEESKGRAKGFEMIKARTRMGIESLGEGVMFNIEVFAEGGTKTFKDKMLVANEENKKEANEETGNSLYWL